MRLNRYFAVAIACAVIATVLVVTLPARIGTHGDDQSDELVVAKRSMTVVGYFVSAETDTGQGRYIGTTPYSQFYLRTYAVEVWMLAVVLAALGARQMLRNRTIV